MLQSFHRRYKLIAPAVAWLVVVLLGVLCPPTSAQTLRIYHIDVDQAEATLLVSPGGRTLLIDSGKNGDADRLWAVMQQAGVSQVDHFVCTHYHGDHYGGIVKLINDFGVSVEDSYDRGDKDYIPQSKRNEDSFVEYERTVGNSADPLTRGQTIPLDPEMLVASMATGSVVLGEEPTVHGIDENDMSIALLIRFGDFRYFIGGDIRSSTEKKIANRTLVFDVDVYQANHHGSETSSSSDFMKDLIPTVVVISNGNHRGHEHPRQSTLNLFSTLNPRPTVFQTNKYLEGGDGGNVADDFIADLEPSGPEGTILITVDRSAGNYTVSYRDRAHTFPIKSRSTELVVIESLLPNPVASDRDFEEVTLGNRGAVAVLMAGWILQDESGRIWPLVRVGTIEPNSSATVWRNRMPMSLNNSGDEIVLIDPSNQVRDLRQSRRLDL